MLTPALRDISPLLGLKGNTWTAITASSSAVFINSPPPGAVCPLAEPGAEPGSILFHFSAQSQRNEAFLSSPFTLIHKLFISAYKQRNKSIKSFSATLGTVHRCLCPCNHVHRSILIPRQSTSSSPCLYAMCWQGSPGPLFCFLFPLSASCCLLSMEWPWAE